MAYPPPNFGLVIPSTIFLSTVRVSGSFSGSSNFLDSFGWPGAGGDTPLPSTIIGYQGITTSRALGLQGDFSTINAKNLNVAGSGARIALGDLGQGGNIVTGNSNAVANFASLGASTIRLNGNFSGSSNILHTFGWPGNQSFPPLPSTIIGYQGITTSIATGLQAAFSTTSAQNLNVVGSGSRIALGDVAQGGDIVTNNPNAVANFARLGASTISTTNLNVSGSINGALNINGFTTMSNAQAFGITANTLTASNTIQGDVLTGRVIQATENLTSPLLTLQNLNVQQVATVSTGVVSSLFTQFINNLPYPPQSGVTGATPSTMFASTVFINGGLTVSGLGQNFITRANISSLSSVSVTGLLNASTILFNGGMTNTGNLPIITSNLSAVNIQNVLFINGQVYPPPIGSVSLQSTLFLSSVFVNGGLNMSNTPLTFIDTGLNRTNGNIYANSGTMQVAIPEVGSPGGSAFTITAGSTLASTLMFLSPTGRVRFTSSMTVRDAISLGSPSQAYITTYSPGSEAPAGSVITANVSTPSINTSSITLSGSGSRIVGDAPALGPGVNILSDDLQIYSASGTTRYFDMTQGVGSTFFTFGNELATPNFTYLTAGNYWTYSPGIGNPPSGHVVTSNISTVNLVASTISGQYITASTVVGSNAFFENTSTNTLWAGNTSTNTLWAGNLSTPTISVSSINNFSALPSISGNLIMTLDTTNGAGGFGSFQIQPQSSLYLKTSLSIGSVGSLADTLRRYAASSIGSAQVNPHIVLSADSIVSTANIAWGFAKDGSPPTTTSLSYFINNLSTSKTNVKTNLGWIGLPNSELYNVLDQTLTPGYLTIKNTTNSVVYVEGVPQYASATTTPYGI